MQECSEGWWRAGFMEALDVRLLPKGTHMFKHTGMCRNFGSVICTKSQSMGPIGAIIEIPRKL